MPSIPYAGQGQALYPHAFPAAAGWRKREDRWRDYGILLGLWVLVLLVAVAVGVRALERSAGAAGPDVFPRAATTPASRASPAAFAISRLTADDDPFDDSLPSLPQATAPARMPAPAETATAVASTPVSSDIAAARAQQPATVSGGLALVPAAAPMPEACLPALSAMQLCNEAAR